ncbi:elongation factor 1-delta 1 [Citrus sinensis]|uniref:Elongation factor 1-delta 1 n=1 Tax=Citrus sinensis TaxID=2711 RepID=A0ACB8JKP8_CITSI|nr:elongation factor 1-delta 1 [Citrus sinensis]
MPVTFYDLNSDTGLKKLDDYLLTRSYITLLGIFLLCQNIIEKLWWEISFLFCCAFIRYQASKDDITVYAALSKPPSSEYVNVSRWYNHIDALLRISGVSAEGSGVIVEGYAPIATLPVDDKNASSVVLCSCHRHAAAADDDNDDVDLFGEETEEEKKAAEERSAAIKASAKKKESSKSSVLLDIKPWDDETDMQKLEEAVRSIKMEGLHWGACNLVSELRANMNMFDVIAKLVPVGYDIKKLQIMFTIVDDLVYVDNLIEEHLMAEPINEYVQSCDIVAFNKICSIFVTESKNP